MATRLSVNVNDETAAALRELADQDEISVTEVIRRAVSVYKFFVDARAEDKTIQLVSADETKTLVHLV